MKPAQKNKKHSDMRELAKVAVSICIAVGAGKAAIYGVNKYNEYFPSDPDVNPQAQAEALHVINSAARYKDLKGVTCGLQHESVFIPLSDLRDPLKPVAAVSKVANDPVPYCKYEEADAQPVRTARPAVAAISSASTPR